MAAARKTKEQQLAAIVAAEKKLAEKKAKLLSKLSDLSRESQGMEALLDVVQNVAESNNATVADVIRAVAKLKRTGLKIEKSTRQPKDPNAPKKPRGPKKLKKELPP